jgi:DNA-binding transcriptional LysR family regulator
LELRHLRVVCAIAETGSVTKAAAALGLAQPALTAQLQRIERMLGGPLFERSRRGARPTPLGELVLDRARVLLPAVKTLQDDATRLAGTGEPVDRFRIGAVNGPILGGLVHRLAEDHPQAHITTYASWEADELAGMVLAGRLDYAVVGVCGDANPPDEYGLAWRVVGVDPVFVLLPESHELADRDEVALAELSHAQWAAGPGESCFADCFSAACARAGFTPRKIYETDVRGCVDLVEAGAAVALCQASFRPAAGLTAAPIAGAPLRWRHLLGWHPAATSDAHAQQLVGYARASHADVVERNPRYAEWRRRNPSFGTTRLAAA